MHMGLLMVLLAPPAASTDNLEEKTAFLSLSPVLTSAEFLVFPAADQEALFEPLACPLLDDEAISPEE